MLKSMDPYFSKPKISLQNFWNISCAVTRLIFTSFFWEKIFKGLACMVKIPEIKLMLAMPFIQRDNAISDNFV